MSENGHEDQCPVCRRIRQAHLKLGRLYRELREHCAQDHPGEKAVPESCPRCRALYEELDPLVTAELRRLAVRHGVEVE